MFVENPKLFLLSGTPNFLPLLQILSTFLFLKKKLFALQFSTLQQLQKNKQLIPHHAMPQILYPVKLDIIIC